MQKRTKTNQIIAATQIRGFEKDRHPVAVAQAAYAANVTDIAVDEADFFTAGDILHVVSTGEQMLVTVVTTATNTLTVTRGYGTIAAAAIPDDATIILLGNCFEEGSAATTPKSSSLK